MRSESNPAAPGPAIPPDPWGDKDFEQAVRETAYFLWESDGRPQGREKEYWFRALERSLRQRGSDRELRDNAPPPRDDTP